MINISHIRKFIEDEDGATMVEYVIMVGLVAIAALTAITAFGSTLQDSFGMITEYLMSSPMPGS